MENSRNKRFVSFKLCAIPSSETRSCAVPPGTRVTSLPSGAPAGHMLPAHSSLSSRLRDPLDCHSIAARVFKKPSSHFIMAPKLKSRYADDSETPKRSQKVYVV